VTEKKRWRVCGVFLAAMTIMAAAWVTLPAASPGEAATVIYVTQAGAGNRSGTSWSNACGETEFKTALDNAPAGSEIWVAKGTYRPSLPAAGVPANREASFALKSGVTLYGGFLGGETTTRQRDYRKNVTVLTGDLKGDDNSNPDGVTETAAGIVGENCYTVVTSFGAAAPNTGILDGFTITGGSADWTDTNTGGAKQYGGGMHNTGSHAVVRNCSFRGNTAEWGGGAIYNASSNIRLGYCTFSGNGGRSGAGMYNQASSPELVSCTFTDNAVRTDAGAIHNYDGSSPTISG
jgi:predicted outer membrane repeat protein